MNKVELMAEQYELQALISAGHVKSNDFTNDMAHRVRHTQKQKDWVHKLVAEGNKAAEAAKTVNDAPAMPLAVDRVFWFLKHAANPKLKSPSIRVLYGAAGQSLSDYLTFQLAKPESRNPGYCYVYASGVGYLGKISPTGVLTAKYPFTAEMKAATIRFAINPWEEVMRFARAHGRCCFCDASLFDARGWSQLWGYGPVCAKHHGLEHGNYHKKVGTVDKFPTELIPVDWRPLETVPEDFYAW